MEFILLIFSGLITYFFIPYIRALLINNNIVSVNYKGHTIPVSMGIAFIPVILINLLVLTFFLNEFRFIITAYFAGIASMAFIGLADDLIGNREATGFKGHFGSLLKGELTTGFFKAMAGGLTSLFISCLFSSSIIDLLVNTMIIALFTNMINLLDLRPGRAVKGFFLIAVIFIIIGTADPARYIIFAVLGYCAAYLPQDLKAESMMGDAGSNPLGVILGMTAVLSFNLNIRLIILSILLLIHLIAEKYSISKIIESNSVLDYFDKLGRK